MLTRITVVVAGLVLVTGGCVSKVYDIKLEPQGAVMKRTLDVHVEGSGEERDVAPIPELDQIATLYPPNSVVIGDHGERIFTGTFTGQMPADVGGFGRHEHLASPLGSWSIYHERFGFVALTDESLAQYVVWYHGLDDQERTLWDEMLSQVQSKDNPLAVIGEFRFPHSSDLHQTPLKLIESAWNRPRASKS